MTGKRIWLMIGAITLAQSLVLGWMLFDRITLLRGGREIVLDVEPVDPRSLFRGDYVTLGYGNLSRLEGVTIPKEQSFTESEMAGRPVFVTLAKSATGTWEKIAAGLDRPTSVTPDQVVLAGRITSFWSDSSGGSAQIAYGIESYFVPEDTGKPIEAQAADKKLQVQVAVDLAGRAAIKGIIMGGKTVLTEPWL